jgi:AraC-like DNA-binding protein
VHLDLGVRVLALLVAHLVDLALAAGFSDQAHFSREFKSLIGCSPRTYASRIGRMHDPPARAQAGTPSMRSGMFVKKWSI